MPPVLLVPNQGEAGSVWSSSLWSMVPVPVAPKALAVSPAATEVACKRAWLVPPAEKSSLRMAAPARAAAHPALALLGTPFVVGLGIPRFVLAHASRWSAPSTLRAAYASKVCLPRLVQAYEDGTGDPGLRPERSDTWEADSQHELPDWAAFDAAACYCEVGDLITRDTFTGVNQARDRRSLHGVQFTAEPARRQAARRGLRAEPRRAPGGRRVPRRGRGELPSGPCAGGGPATCGLMPGPSRTGVQCP